MLCMAIKNKNMHSRSKQEAYKYPNNKFYYYEAFCMNQAFLLDPTVADHYCNSNLVMRMGPRESQPFKIRIIKILICDSTCKENQMWLLLGKVGVGVPTTCHHGDSISKSSLEVFLVCREDHRDRPVTVSWKLFVQVFFSRACYQVINSIPPPLLC